MTSVTDTGAINDPLKWGMPGWRVERKFDDKVLIGNWYEERLKVSQRLSVIIRNELII